MSLFRLLSYISTVALLLTISNSIHALSEFELYLQKMQSVLPTPFTKLEAQLKGDYPSHHGTIHIHSRALKIENVSATKPKRMIVVKETNYDSNPAPFYLAHQYEQDEIEAISWNKKTRNYEFLIIENYKKGQKVKIKKGPQVRKDCMSCHQNGGPIFAAAPWDESISNEEVRNIVETHFPNFQGYQTITEDFDNEIRVSNQALNLNNFCKELCSSDDLKCKKKLLYLAIKSLSGSRNFQNDQNVVNMIKELRVKFAQRDFMFRTGVISDFNPITNLTTYIQDTNTNEIHLDSLKFPLSDLEDMYLEDGQSIKKVNGFLGDHYGDPSKLRPKLSGVNLSNWQYKAEELSVCYDFKKSDFSFDKGELYNKLFQSNKLDRQLEINHLDSESIGTLLK
jgi:hypothetical protein